MSGQHTFQGCGGEKHHGSQFCRAGWFSHCQTSNEGTRKTNGGESKTNVSMARRERASKTTNLDCVIFVDGKEWHFCIRNVRKQKASRVIASATHDTVYVQHRRVAKSQFEGRSRSRLIHEHNCDVDNLLAGVRVYHNSLVQRGYQRYSESYQMPCQHISTPALMQCASAHYALPNSPTH